MRSIDFDGINIQGLTYGYAKDIKDILNKFIDAGKLTTNHVSKIRHYIVTLRPIHKQDYVYTKMVLLGLDLSYYTDTNTFMRKRYTIIEDSRVSYMNKYNIFRVYENTKKIGTFKTDEDYKPLEGEENFCNELCAIPNSFVVHYNKPKFVNLVLNWTNDEKLVNFIELEHRGVRDVAQLITDVYNKSAKMRREQ